MVGVLLKNITFWYWCELVAACNGLTALIKVSVGTLETMTSEFVCLCFVKVATRAVVCVAPTFFGAAYMVVSVAAIVCGTKQLPGVPAVQMISRASKKCTSAFCYTASLIILL
jgi:hypothetical protein